MIINNSKKLIKKKVFLDELTKIWYNVNVVIIFIRRNIRHPSDKTIILN